MKTGLPATYDAKTLFRATATVTDIVGRVPTDEGAAVNSSQGREPSAAILRSCCQIALETLGQQPGRTPARYTICNLRYGSCAP
jgi:hypothetical protein